MLILFAHSDQDGEVTGKLKCTTIDLAHHLALRFSY